MLPKNDAIVFIPTTPFYYKLILKIKLHCVYKIISSLKNRLYSMLFHRIMNFFYHFIYSSSSIKVYLNASLFSKQLEEKYFYKWSKMDYS